MVTIEYNSIGVIHSRFQAPAGTPIQPTAAKGEQGQVEVFTKYAEGLKDLDGFSHIYLLYHFHKSKPYSLRVKPFLDNIYRGLFATRAPSRPNPIGLSIVRLIGIEKNVLTVEDVDIVNGTPLIDIKPYVPQFDVHEVETCGWLQKPSQKVEDAMDDGRFSK